MVGGKLSAADVLEAFDPLWRIPIGEHPHTISIAVPPAAANLHPDALCALARCLLRARDKGLLITFTGELRNGNRLANYLARTNLFGLLGLHPPGLPRPVEDKIGLHVPLRKVATSAEVTRTVNDLIEMLLRQSICSEGVAEGFEWAVNEVIDNVLVHAESPVGAIVIGQTIAQPPCIRVAVGDLGRGILESLRESQTDLPSGKSAILRAVQAGITRNRDIGQGNGLAGTREIAGQNGGTLERFPEPVIIGFAPVETR